MEVPFVNFLALALSLLAADVTKEDVKKLLAAGVDEKTILAYVERNRPVAKVSADDVIELKKAGASDRVIEALLSPAPARQEKREVVVVRPEVYSYGWYDPWAYYRWHYGYPRYSWHYYRPTYVYPHTHVHTHRPRSFSGTRN